MHALLNRSTILKRKVCAWCFHKRAPTPPQSLSLQLKSPCSPDPSSPPCQGTGSEKVMITRPGSPKCACVHVCWSSKAVVPKYHTLTSVNTRNFLLHSSRGWSSEARVSAGVLALGALRARLLPACPLASGGLLVISGVLHVWKQSLISAFISALCSLL